MISDLLVDPSVIKRLRLQPMQVRLLGLLMRRVTASHEQILSHLYGHRADGGPDTAEKWVEVYLHRLRRVLKPHRIEIQTLHRVGYFMDNKSKQRARALLAGSLQ